jgi:uncharacterized protein YunC (DUF1805 family)
MPNVCVQSVPSKGATALGLTAAWEDSQFVVIITKKGMVACGVVDKNVMQNVGAAIAISRGTKEKPLVTIDDLLNAKIMDVTEKAADYGIKVGMSGKEALDILTA